MKLQVNFLVALKALCTIIILGKSSKQIFAYSNIELRPSSEAEMRKSVLLFWLRYYFFSIRRQYHSTRSKFRLLGYCGLSF